MKIHVPLAPHGNSTVAGGHRSYLGENLRNYSYGRDHASVTRSNPGTSEVDHHDVYRVVYLLSHLRSSQRGFFLVQNLTTAPLRKRDMRTPKQSRARTTFNAFKRRLILKQLVQAARRIRNRCRAFGKERTFLVLQMMPHARAASGQSSVPR